MKTTKKTITEKFQDTLNGFNQDPEVLFHLSAINDKFKITIQEFKEFVDSCEDDDKFFDVFKGFLEKNILDGKPLDDNWKGDYFLIMWILRTSRFEGKSIFTDMLHRMYKQDPYDSKYKLEKDFEDKEDYVDTNEKQEEKYLNTYNNWFDSIIEELSNE